MNPNTLHQYDFEYHFVNVSEGRMHYIDEGSGPILLMLHGNPTWSYLYRHLIHDLKDRFRCVAVDNLGFGLSDKPSRADYTIAGHTSRLTEFMKVLGLRDVTPIVQDWGGPIGLGWAVENKDAVSRLVILNTMAFNPRPKDFSPGVMRTLAKLKGSSLPLVGEWLHRRRNMFIKNIMPSWIHNAEHRTPEIMRGYEYPFPDYASRVALLQMPREIPMTPLHRNFWLLDKLSKKLKGWDVPALIVWAQLDPAFPPGFAQRFADHLPNHQPIIRIENASHYLQEDTPEPIIEAIRRFIPEPSEVPTSA